MKYELDLQDARIEGKEEGIAEGIEIGRSEGLEEGRNETLLLIIENMKKQGLTSEQTAALTGLTVDEVEELRKRVR